MRDNEHMKWYSALLKRWEVPCDNSEEASWAGIQQKIAAGMPRETRLVRFRPVYRVAAAAAVLLCAGAYWFFIPSAPLAVTNTGRDALRVDLPDGSLAMLNAGSSVTYAEQDGKRLVTLEGEAYFEVQKGRSFEVTGRQISVKVLGTTFNVHDRAGVGAVTCFEGKVSVTTPSGQEVVLPGGEGVLLAQDGTWKKTYVDPAQKTWVDGEYYFENAPLEQVLEEIERQFGVKVVYSGKAGRSYTGYFRDNQLEEALSLICAALDMTYTTEANQRVLLEEKPIAR